MTSNARGMHMGDNYDDAINPKGILISEMLKLKGERCALIVKMQLFCKIMII